MSPNYKNLKIKSDSLTLTSLTKDFAEDIFRGNSGNVRDFFLPFENQKEVQNWVETNLELMETGQKIELVLLDEKQDFVGMLSLRDLETEPAFGLWITPSKQNQGYAKRSMKMFIDWIFKNTNLSKLFYAVSAKNTASISLVKSLNGQYTRDFLDEDQQLTREFIFDKKDWQSFSKH